VDLDRFATLGRATLPESAVAARHNAQEPFLTASERKSDAVILFGDLHVHTTYSIDAFQRALPMVFGADGATPPTDACNYARYVSQLDFFAITDHAEEITPENWRKTIDALRLCATVGGRGVVPDVIPFLGFEWSQVGTSAATHWGHHNTIFEYLDEGRIPSRPIRAPTSDNATIGTMNEALFINETPENRAFYEAYNRFAERLAGIATCPAGADVRRDDCQEVARTPGDLLRKLQEWGFAHIVIPHGGAWGLYTPPKSSWDHELNAREFDPDVVKLIEVYSPHGNSEQFRPFQEYNTDAEGHLECPGPSRAYLPECWQAGEIIRARCARAGQPAAECDRRAVKTRAAYLAMPGLGGGSVVPHSTPEEWLDAGQARDIFMPAFNYRPLKSVQYGLAITNFDDPTHHLRFKWGLIASTDNHSARAGSGFRQSDREHIVDLWGGLKSKELAAVMQHSDNEQNAPRDRGVSASDVPKLAAFEFERLGSFLSMGGLVAVHANNRSREAIWDALEARRVYGTSGVRILLDFELVNFKGENGQARRVPMGGEVTMARHPVFRVTVSGSLKQRAGCPSFVGEALNSVELRRLANNECYYPTGERNRIDRIEVVRIRPQAYLNEDVSHLIKDPWRVLSCRDKFPICRVQFSDPDFSRDSVYYVRALEEPTPVVNGKNLRTRFDENGNAVDVKLCYMDYRTNPRDDCLANVQQRAWSSPIFVDKAAQQPTHQQSVAGTKR
jgi:hypothetical protein